jgi:hypothetical protein
MHSHQGLQLFNPLFGGVTNLQLAPAGAALIARLAGPNVAIDHGTGTGLLTPAAVESLAGQGPVSFARTPAQPARSVVGQGPVSFARTPAQPAGAIAATQYSTSFQPTDLSGLKLWLDANDLDTLWQDSSQTTAVSANNDPVGAWEDKSGNNHDVSQATSGKRPTYKTGIQNGLPIIRFDGTNDTLSRTITGNAILATNAATIYLAMLQDGTKDINIILAWDAPDNANRFRLFAAFSDDKLYFDHGNSSSGGRISVAQPAGWNDVFHLVELFRDGTTTAEIIVDGTTLVSSNMSDGLDTSGSYNFQIVLDGGYFKGDLAEIVIYNRALTATERGQVESYLSDKWGI